MALFTLANWPLLFLSAAMIVAAVIDAWKFKVPNWLTFPLVLTGWVLGLLHDLGLFTGTGVGGIGASENVEESSEVSDCARHWTYDADPAVRIIAGRKVSCAGDATGRRFESADAAEVRGDANGAAAVTADAAEGKTSGDRGGFPAARTA